MVSKTATDPGRLVAVITGASSGIGEAAAHRLAQVTGSHVVLVARREERLVKLAEQLIAAGGKATYVAVDLTDDQAPDLIKNHLVSNQLMPTVLVNNAGAGFRSTFFEGGYANIQKTFAINFDAQVRVTEALLPLLRENSPAAIVNISSTAARVTRAGAAAYSASKAALAAWSDGLRAEEAPYGVTVANVLPGFIPTEGFPAEELKNKPIARLALGSAEGVAEAIFAGASGKRAEIYTPKGYAAIALLRSGAPGLIRAATSSKRVQAATTTKTRE